MRIEVPAEAAGERLDVFLARARRLARRGAALDRRRPRARRRRGAREAPRAARRRGRGGASRSPRRRRSRRPRRRFAIAWEDEHLLVVDKPAGVVVHPARGHASGTLAQALERRGAAGGEPGRAGLVHRLDRDTSGLLVVARSEAVHAALKARAARRARILREYLALVEGRPGARTGKIEAPLGRDRRVRTRISTDTADGRARGHALRDRGGARRLHAAARAARDRAHAPDPRAPEGDRPPGGGRPGVRPRRRCSASSASSSTPSTSPSSIPSPASASTSARRSPTTSPRARRPR